MCMKLYVCEFIFPRVLDSCVHTWCVSVMWLTVLYTCVSEHAYTAVQDMWEYKARFHTHKCGYCRAPSKMHENTHVYEFIRVRIYIPTCLGWLCKHAQTHMYIIYKIMSVCYRAPSETCGNTHVYKTVSCKSHDWDTPSVHTAVQDVWEYKFAQDDFIHMCLGIHTAVQDP